MTMTQEERISRLEGAFETFSVVAATMVTKEELQSAIDGLRAGTTASIDGLQSETTSSIDGLRAEQRTSVETLRAENQATAETLRAEMRSMELRIIRWMVGAVFAASGLILAVMKLLP